MKIDTIQRRAFLGSACGTLGLWAMAGGTAAGEASAGRQVPA
jgi:hypothetical protein